MTKVQTYPLNKRFPDFVYLRADLLPAIGIIIVKIVYEPKQHAGGMEYRDQHL